METGGTETRNFPKVAANTNGPSTTVALSIFLVYAHAHKGGYRIAGLGRFPKGIRTRCVQRAGRSHPILRKCNCSINNWGVGILHSYPARADLLNGYWERLPNGSVVITPEFDRLLAEMAVRMNLGEVLFTTISTLVRHLIHLRGIFVSIHPGGVVVIQNSNKEAVMGVGVAFAGRRRAFVEGKDIPVKVVNENSIISVDIASEGTISIVVL